MGEKVRKIVVDTYVLLAMVFDELTDVAKEIMLDIYKGKHVNSSPQLSDTSLLFIG